MNITLWIFQVMLAVVFLLHGWLFLSPPAEMLELMNSSIAPGFRIFIGAAEVLAAVGLTLPGITRIMPWLIPCAAAGLMIVMTGATWLHATRGENGLCDYDGDPIRIGRIRHVYALEGDTDLAATVR